MTDPNKKVSRQFQCREALWQKFEQMAKELECSVDYLINDAMKQYARQRGYGASTTIGPAGPSAIVGGPPPPPPPSSAPAHVAPPPPLPIAAPPLPPALSSAGSATPPPLPPSASVAPTGLPPLPGSGRPAAPPKRGAAPPPPPPPPGASRRAAPPPLAAPRSMPPGAAARAPAPAPVPAGALSIHYQGEVFPVTKDRFIIGRGKQTSDLTIKDPNVSRQHAMIEFSNGQYFIVDMGSTNGVEYNGQRVQRRSIGEGDIYKVCDHELRFSFH